MASQLTILLPHADTTEFEFCMIIIFVKVDFTFKTRPVTESCFHCLAGQEEPRSECPGQVNLKFAFGKEKIEVQWPIGQVKFFTYMYNESE